MINSLANKLTFSRIIVIPIILFLLFIRMEWAAWAALVLFVAAGITDLLDGYLARREGQVSKMGEFLDPIADKLLVAAVILLLVYNGHITGLAIVPAVIILMREVARIGLARISGRSARQRTCQPSGEMENLYSDRRGFVFDRRRLCAIAACDLDR